MPKTIKQLYEYLRTNLLENEEQEARIILKQRANIDWGALITEPDRELPSDIIEDMMSDVMLRRAGKPLSKIYGRQEFWGLTFEVNEDTLDPRQDSETLIEAVLKHYEMSETQPVTILDLGTGTGCLLLSLLSEFKGAQGVGVDASLKAAQTARRNAENLKMSDRATFICGEWTESLQQKYDLVIANPPYIRSKVIPELAKEVKNYDPILALDGGDDGLQAYRQIFKCLEGALNKGGYAAFEIGFDQADDVMRLSKESGFVRQGVHHDLAGNPRVVDMSKK